MRFADIRRGKKLNRKQFADSLGINQSVAGDIELGKREPSRNVLIQLAKIHHVNINWLLTGEGSMFLPSLQKEEDINISGIGNVGNMGGVQHFTMLPAEISNPGLIPILGTQVIPKTIENDQGELSMFKIPLLTREQVFHFNPAKEITEPKAHSGDYPDYTLVPIPMRLREYGTDLRAMVVFNSLMAPLLRQGDMAIFQATGWNEDGIYVYRMKNELYINHVRFNGREYVLTKEFKPEEEIPYHESFEPIGRIRAVVREIR
jgi:transcriptional regulator with XRE-family HTH domain